MHHSSGVMVAVPSLKDCATVEVEQIFATHIIYNRTYFAYPAIYCARITRKICTHAFFHFVLDAVSGGFEVRLFQPEFAKL